MEKLPEALSFYLRWYGEESLQAFCQLPEELSDTEALSLPLGGSGALGGGEVAWGSIQGVVFCSRNGNSYISHCSWP